MAQASDHPLVLRLFGPFRAWVRGQPLPKLRSRKGVWLLCLLTLHTRTPLERAWLAATLWPDAADEAGLYNLRRNLSLLREALGPEAGRLLAPTPRTLQIDLQEADCDLTAFDDAIRRGDHASLATAAALYQSPLLRDCAEEWAFPEREARGRAIAGALEALAAEAHARGSLAEAAGHLRRTLEIDPLCETALRGLLKALAAQGSHAAATEAYHQFRRRLHAQLNAVPDPETSALYRKLRAEARQAAHPQASMASPALERPTILHLPSPLTALIGREAEIEAVAAHLNASRLVMLTGTGGVGKTRLALAVGACLHDEFADGAWFVDIAPLADPKLLVQAVLAALQVQETLGRSPSQTLADFLRPKRLLLILDNCEHLLTACAHFSQALLEQCPALHILATSREPLGITGEVTYRVPSLSLTDGAETSASPSDAARLFLDRATQARPGWKPSATELQTIAQICRFLDGIPLAIEMAAARSRSLPVEGIASRLGEAFQLLLGQGSGPVERHQTLRATLEWSWDLLDLGERTLLSRLSVFAGGWTLEAAEDICGSWSEHSDAWQALNELTGLIDKSLVVYEQVDGDEPRYRLLETVRQYTRERLAEGSEADVISRRHATHFLALTEAAEAELTGAGQSGWLTRLEAEHDNLRAALTWCLTNPDEAESGLHLVGTLERFWVIRGHLEEGRQWLDQMLKDTGRSEPTSGRVKAFNCLGNIAFGQGDFPASCKAHQESLAICRLLKDEHGVARSLTNLGNTHWSQGNYRSARLLHEESLAIRRRLGDGPGIARVLGNLGNVAYACGDYPAAQALHEESLRVARQLGDQQVAANALQNLGNVAQEQGDYAQAKVLAEESLAIRRLMKDRHGIAAILNSLGIAATKQREHEEAIILHEESLAIKLELGDTQGIAYSLHNLGDIFTEKGDSSTAQRLHRESLMLLRQIGDQYGIVHSLEALAGNALCLERPHITAHLLGAAEAMREALGCPLGPADRPHYDTMAATTRAMLGNDAFAAAWAEGLAMSSEQAAKCAHSGDD